LGHISSSSFQTMVKTIDKQDYKLYDGEVELVFHPGKHAYTVDSVVVPGVTGITGVIAKDSLKWWSATAACMCFVEWLTGGTYSADMDNKGALIRLKEGDITVPPVNEGTLIKAITNGRFAHSKIAKKAADIGTMAHEYIEGYIKHGLKLQADPPEMPTNEKAQAAIQAFMDWEKANEVIYLESEKKVYSKKYKYAGTLDIVAKVNGRMSVVDLKTSKAIYVDYWLQTAAYQQAYQEETGIDIKNRWIVNIRKDGSLETAQSEEFEADLRGFLGAHLLYARLNKLEFPDMKDRI
jgi:hypothetical protein